MDKLNEERRAIDKVNTELAEEKRVKMNEKNSRINLMKEEYSQHLHNAQVKYILISG